jgi:Zn-dependent M32 family carboxypeptidase
MTDNILSAYKHLLDITKDLILLSTAQGIVHWDMETMMPPKAVELRSQQLALLSRIGHRMSTAPEIGKLLKEIMASPQYDAFGEVEKRNVFLIKKSYDEQTALPEKLVSEIAMQQAVTVNTWKKAKKAQNFAVLKSELKKLVALRAPRDSPTLAYSTSAYHWKSSVKSLWHSHEPSDTTPPRLRQGEESMKLSTRSPADTTTTSA